MLKIAVILVLICVLFRWGLGKWPWELAKGPSGREQELSKARQLLRVAEDADCAEIAAAHKRLIAVVHPDKGGSAEQVYEANAARDLLYEELPGPVPVKARDDDDNAETPPE